MTIDEPVAACAPLAITWADPILLVLGYCRNEPVGIPRQHVRPHP